METATEHAKQIRQTLKTKHGWTSRDVSVRSEYYSMGSAIRVKIKNADVNPHIVEAIARSAESIRWCPITHDILSGGNLFVTSSYTMEAADEIAQKHIAAVEAAKAELDAAVSDGRSTALVPIGPDTGEEGQFLLGRADNADLSLWVSGSGHVAQAWTTREIGMAMESEIRKAAAAA